MEKMNSPLHKVIDAQRWDGELLLGRLFILFHAAFLPAAADPASSGFLPKQVGSTASTLSLRYLVPQILAFDGLCRRVLAEICGGGSGIALPSGTSFMSLPEEMKASILARLDDGADLARASACCGELRRLVAERDRELWEPLYRAAQRMGVWTGMTWKELYVMSKCPEEKWPAGLAEKRFREFSELYTSLQGVQIADDDLQRPPLPTYDDSDVPGLFRLLADAHLAGLAEEETAAEQSRGETALPSSSSSSGGRQLRRRRRAVAIANLPSARYRWKRR